MYILDISDNLELKKIFYHHFEIYTLGRNTRQSMIVVVKRIPAAWIPNLSPGCEFRDADTGPTVAATTTIVYIEIPSAGQWVRYKF